MVTPRRKSTALHVAAGDRFGRLTVMDPEPRTIVVNDVKRRAVTCSCDCGGTTEVRVSSLMKPGGTKSCGCWTSQSVAEWNHKHGLSRETLYTIHQGMMSRCYKQNNKSYWRYGGRGISVFEEWHDVEKFIAWIEANIGPRPAGMSIDRKDNDGNYEPGNVRWATPSQQGFNRRQRRTAIEQRSRIRRYLGEHPDQTAEAIARGLETNLRTIRHHLVRMERDGEVEALRGTRSNGDSRAVTRWRAA